MKRRELYTCEICNTDYASAKDAEECEKSHLPTKGKGFKVEGVYRPFRVCKDGVPVKLWVTFPDGRKILYRR